MGGGVPERGFFEQFDAFGALLSPAARAPRVEKSPPQTVTLKRPRPGPGTTWSTSMFKKLFLATLIVISFGGAIAASVTPAAAIHME